MERFGRQCSHWVDAVVIALNATKEKFEKRAISERRLTQDRGNKEKNDTKEQYTCECVVVYRMEGEPKQPFEFLNFGKLNCFHDGRRTVQLRTACSFRNNSPL